MAGTIFDNFGRPRTPVTVPGYVQPQAVINPAVTAQSIEPFLVPNTGQGVSQFLTGNLAIPMQFGVDLPEFQSMPFNPGDFASFMKAQGGGSAKAPMIPVFDPATGTYTAYKAPALRE